jgi:hypothetical protein
MSDDAYAPFWKAAEDALLDADVEKGTMMGFPCLRLRGTFFASCERATGDLIVKLPAERVRELMATGEAVAFAPNGRTFREWALITGRDAARWRNLIAEALAFATT